jgi:hypothetical protein
VWIDNLEEFHTEGGKPADEKLPDPITLFARDGDSKVESAASAAPTETKDETVSYPSPQLYGHPDNNRGV